MFCFCCTCFSLFKTSVVLEHLFAILFTFLYHVRFVSRVNPRQLNAFTLSIFTLSILRLRVCVSFQGK